MMLCIAVGLSVGGTVNNYVAAKKLRDLERRVAAQQEQIARLSTTPITKP